MMYEATIIREKQRISSCVGEKDSLTAWICTQLESFDDKAVGELHCLDKEEKTHIITAKAHFD